ncbi:glycosyltransferase [Oscillatoriales cyanobacterium LEGE 11467]|uniref:Glycosyltransferase n=2 Tax=Zarconia TaxID=2992130 RepID=A0A928Z866_9CYAN|nr:glycosyltransferase [Zarconia navalis LEGE 11467]
MARKPKISIVLPVFNPPESFLRDCLDSVLAQTYPHWDLCIADDASTQPYVRSILLEYQECDRRVKIIFRSENGHICRASNSALELATGEFIALLDHDDVLSIDALEEVAKLLAKYPDADFIYSDEDKIDDRGNLKFPFYKPDWCPDTFLSRMYTCHLGVYRRSLVKEIGGFRVGYEGSQDYDLVLRITERTDRIFHIPKILYHWRLYSESTSSGSVAKPYVSRAARQALEDALERREEAGVVQAILGVANHHLIRYSISGKDLVSIILMIPNSGTSLHRCLESIFKKSQYSCYEVIANGNGDRQVEVNSILIDWQIREPLRFRYYFTFAYSNDYQLQNEAVRKAKGEYLLFLSSEIEVETPDWIEAMVEQAQRQSIGAIGSLILYPDRRVFHAGIILSLHEIDRYSHQGLADTAAGYFGYLKTINNVSAVTDKCLMCRRHLFEEVGGFDEQLAVVYGDINLCLKFRLKGYNNVYLPHVRATYYSAVDREKQDRQEWGQLLDRSKIIVRQRWKSQLERDPCYNRNLQNLNYQKKTKLPKIKADTFIITGMHRSGTSLIASVFDILGVYLGKRLLTADRFNSTGYFEDLDFLNLQRSILQASCSVSEVGWVDWGWNREENLDKSGLQNYYKPATSLIQSRQQTLKPWGWKDPRTSLLLHFWDSLLPEAKYIFVYRVPWEVSNSISRLHHPFFQEHSGCAIEIWRFYNRHLLEFYQKHPDRCILVNIHAFSRSPTQFLNLLQAKLGMEVRDEWRSQIGEIFQPQLFHHTDDLASNVRQLRQTAPECLEILTELEKVADIPSGIFLEDDTENLEINVKKVPPLVSVIIPCFNHGEFLEDAIQSIEEYPEPIYEIIIVNDGSTDEITQKAIANLKQRGYQIIEQANQGLATARNIGIESASGEYILPLDADNKIRSNYIRKGIEILKQHPKIGVVYGNARLFGEDSSIFQVPDFNLYQLLIGNYIDACAIFRKQVWKDCGGYDPNIPEKLGYEDWDFWLSAVEVGWEFYHLREVTFDYRVRHNSMVAACNLPKHRKKLFRYICNKHFNLFLPYLPDLLAEKEATALQETRRGNLLASQINTLQSHLISKMSQKIEDTSRKPLTISQSPLVSICIPTYNGDRFLKDALSSAFAQTYPNIEVILSDDRSNDRTLEIAESFREHTSINYTVLSHDRSNLAGNWNHCIDRARGDYIKFIFQDDILDADCVEKMLELAERDREIGLVFSPRLFLLEKGVDRIPSLMQLYRGCRQSHLGWSNLQPIQSGLDLLSDPNLMENPINKIGEPSTVLIRKAVFDRVGKFDSQFNQFIDLEMWWRILLYYQVGFIDRNLSYFRLHSQQTTRKNITKKLFDLDRLYYKISTANIFEPLPEPIKVEAFCRYLLSIQNLTTEDRVRLHHLTQKAKKMLSSSIELKSQGEKIEGLLHKISQKHAEIPGSLN